MAKFHLTRGAAEELKTYCSKLQPFFRVFKAGTRKGEVIWNTEKKIVSGKLLISSGTTKDKQGNNINPKNTYRIDFPVSPQIVEPYDFILKIIKEQGMSEKILNDATLLFYKEQDEAIALLEWRKSNPSGDQTIKN